MELKDLYSMIKNPLEDDETIKKLISCCFNSEDVNDFYYNVGRQQRDKYIDAWGYSREENKKIDNSIYGIKGFIYKRWKEHLLILDYDTCPKAIQRLIDILSEYEFDTEDEIIDFEHKNNNKLVNYFSPIVVQQAFTHIRSNALFLNDKSYGDKKSFDKVSHRIYINVDKPYYSQIVIPFIKMCEQNKIPFLLKFEEDTEDLTRDDSFVVYSDHENIMKHIEMLQSIINNDRELKANIDKPHILTGKIDDYLGYGSSETTRYVSYNEKRCAMLYSVIDDYVEKFCADNNLFNDWDKGDVDRTKLEELENSKEHIEKIRRRIESGCIIDDIDPKSFCFDTATLKDIKEYISNKNDLNEMLDDANIDEVINKKTI